MVFLLAYQHFAKEIPTMATTNKLPAPDVKNAKAKDKAYKLADGGGMYLLVNPDGSKYWRMGYRFAGKQKTLAMGVYPDVTLSAARVKRDDARKLLANDVDPAMLKQITKRTKHASAENSFEAVAREWYAKFSGKWVPSHGEKIIRRLERDLFPWLGKRPIAEITAPELLAVLRRIESRGALDTAHRAHQNCGQVFRYAIATGRAERDPSPDLRGAMPPAKETHYPAITDPKAIGDLLRAIRGYKGGFIVGCALRLAPLLFVRPGELRQAEWSEINFDTAEWHIPASKMKMDVAHIVPLATQSVAVLREIQAMTGDDKYVFPGMRMNGKPMSENTVNMALRTLGYTKEELTGHGFRAMARTLLDEVLAYRVDWIEHQLAHAVKDPNGRAYNRTAHLDGRREMMQGWADYLDTLAAGATVLTFKKA
jgi:integrase